MLKETEITTYHTDIDEVKYPEVLTDVDFIGHSTSGSTIIPLVLFDFLHFQVHQLGVR